MAPCRYHAHRTYCLIDVVNRDMTLLYTYMTLTCTRRTPYVSRDLVICVFWRVKDKFMSQHIYIYIYICIYIYIYMSSYSYDREYLEMVSCIYRFGHVYRDTNHVYKDVSP